MRSSENRNRETLQAQSYDRTFILNGPVVKVYETAEESGLGNVYDHQKISFVTDLPTIKNKDGDSITPSNLLLHDNENQLVFKSESDPSKVFIFDLESGKVIQEIKTGKEQINFNQLCNDTKNGQKDVSRTLLGIETQGMHQIDPRVGDNSVVLSKQYKT